MRSMYAPSELSPEQRRRELAGILAAGVLRLRKLRLLAGKPAETEKELSSQSTDGGLEVSGETVLSVKSG